jgi:hypothetical protein
LIEICHGASADLLHLTRLPLIVRAPPASVIGPRAKNRQPRPPRQQSRHWATAKIQPHRLPGWHWNEVNTLGEESGDQLRVIDLLALQQ